MEENSASDNTSDSKREIRQALTRKREVRRFETLENLLKGFGPSERLVLYALSALMAISVLAIVAHVNDAVSTVVPTRGGTLVEGETGPARFVNPVLALSQPDQDITTLVYSGLMRALPDGEVVPDLASSYVISQDGTTYTFTIRSDAKFQDGTPLTADDVVFTVQAAQNPEIKSPRRADWEGVIATSSDPHTVVFRLPHAYAPFIYNTTIGILPKHLWQDISPEEFPFSLLNTHPVGSGPYRVRRVDSDSTGAATRYDLEPFSGFSLSGPYLKRVTFLFYPNEQKMVEAFNARDISAIASLSPVEISSFKRTDIEVLHAPLPRVFGVFFNQNHAALFADSSVRAALDAAVDKQELVQKVLGGYGAPLMGPIPPGIMDVSSVVTSANTPASGPDAAKAILQKGGWKYDESSDSWSRTTGTGKKAQSTTLAFALATADEPELVATANAVATSWRAIGVHVDVQVYSLSELNTNVIRPRSYDAILFGEVVGREGDFFAFWHSSQRNDPGLNLAMYANSKADALLSQARTTTDERSREKLYAQFATIVQKDDPAVFLYAPDFLYAVPRGIKGIELGALTSASDRFLNVHQWYTDEKRVWNIFVTKAQYEQHM